MQVQMTIRSFVRLTNTPNGNPRYKMGAVLADGTEVQVRTLPDAMDAYKITKHVLGQPINADVARRGRVYILKSFELCE